jgi:hypothetical protein
MNLFRWEGNLRDVNAKSADYEEIMQALSKLSRDISKLLLTS